MEKTEALNLLKQYTHNEPVAGDPVEFLTDLVHERGHVLGMDNLNGDWVILEATDVSGQFVELARTQ